MSPLYLVTLKIAQKRPTAYCTAVHSVEPIFPNFSRKLINVHFFLCLLKNSFSSLLTENILLFHGVYQKFIFELNMVNFCM